MAKAPKRWVVALGWLVLLAPSVAQDDQATVDLKREILQQEMARSLQRLPLESATPEALDAAAKTLKPRVEKQFSLRVQLIKLADALAQNPEEQKAYRAGGQALLEKQGSVLVRMNPTPEALKLLLTQYSRPFVLEARCKAAAERAYPR